MVLKLYLDFSSQPSRAVYALCLLAKIPIEIHEIRISKLEMRSQEFTKINPFKKVPAIHDTESNLLLAESHAIMRYLCAKYKTEEKWYPFQDLVRQAKVNEYLDFHHTNTRKCSHLVFNSLFAKNLGIVDPTFNEEATQKQVHAALKLVDTVYLKNSNYIVGQFPSIADLSAFYEIQMLTLLNYNYSKYPNLQRWMKFMKGIKEVNQANQKFYKVFDKMKLQPKL